MPAGIPRWHPRECATAANHLPTQVSACSACASIAQRANSRSYGDERYSPCVGWETVTKSYCSLRDLAHSRPSRRRQSSRCAHRKLHPVSLVTSTARQAAGRLRSTCTNHETPNHLTVFHVGHYRYTDRKNNSKSVYTSTS